MKEPVEKKDTVKEVVLDDKQIQAWKKEHGKIFKTTVGGEDFVWRKLKRKEYVSVMSEANSEEVNTDGRIYKRQESIASHVVLFPTDIDVRLQEDAGLATSLSDEIILKSGFDVSETQEL